MYFNYAHLTSPIIAMLIGLTGYYVDVVLNGRFKGLLWLVITFLFTVGGVVAGAFIKKMYSSSYTDFLTNLWNKRYFTLRLSEEEARAARKNTPLCVAMIDVDNFKLANDTYGHVIGEELLSGVAATLKSNARATDIIARWGGDEFAIIFPETTIQEAFAVMKRINRVVEAKFSSCGLTISAGIIPFEPDKSINDLLIGADQALFKAKHTKNTIFIPLYIE